MPVIVGRTWLIIAEYPLESRRSALDPSIQKGKCENPSRRLFVVEIDPIQAPIDLRHRGSMIAFDGHAAHEAAAT